MDNSLNDVGEAALGYWAKREKRQAARRPPRCGSDAGEAASRPSVPSAPYDRLRSAVASNRLSVSLSADNLLSRPAVSERMSAAAMRARLASAKGLLSVKNLYIVARGAAGETE